MIHTFIVELFCKFCQITQGFIGKFLTSDNRWILIQQLLERNEIAHFNGYGIYASVALVGHEVQLVLIGHFLHIGSLGANTIAECNMIGHLVMKLHEV